VLLVPSMINRWYAVDLRKGASLAAALTADAPWETYCLDWGVPGDEDRYTTWDDIVARLDRAVRFVLRATGAPQVTLIGYSMGATLSAIETALHPSRIAALVNMAGPIDFHEAGRLATMVDARWFDPAAMTAAGNISAAQMQNGFLALAPTHSLARLVGMLDHHHDPEAREAFEALERWGRDNVAFPAAAYVTYIKELYQENRLIKGEHWIGGKRVDLGRIRCPVLTVVADRDGVCMPASSIALNERASSKVKDVVQVSGGHISGFMSRHAADELYPKMVSWLRQHSVRQPAPAPESRL
jgi:polyhydroxyalkanoate synthase